MEEKAWREGSGEAVKSKITTKGMASFLLFLKFYMNLSVFICFRFYKSVYSRYFNLLYLDYFY